MGKENHIVEAQLSTDFSEFPTIPILLQYASIANIDRPILSTEGAFVPFQYKTTVGDPYNKTGHIRLTTGDTNIGTSYTNKTVYQFLIINGSPVSIRRTYTELNVGNHLKSAAVAMFGNLKYSNPYEAFLMPSFQLSNTSNIHLAAPNNHWKVLVPKGISSGIGIKIEQNLSNQLTTEVSIQTNIGNAGAQQNIHVTIDEAITHQFLSDPDIIDFLGLPIPVNDPIWRYTQR